MSASGLVGRAAQVRELDRRVIEDLGIPGVALMELASRGVAEAVRDRFGAAARRGVVVVCGPGNNGGDGWGAARWLRGWGFPVSVVAVGPAPRGDAATQRAAALRSGVAETDRLDGAGVVVDALFGTGLARDVDGDAAAWIAAMDRHGAPVVAVDLPSGLDADTGQPHGACVRAAHTVTFGRWKPGLFVEPGASLAGSLELVDLGFAAAEPADAPLAVAELASAAELARCWPGRAVGAHKGSSGHLLVVAGSLPMAGAAVLACLGALRAGAGLVTLVAPGGALPRLAALPPEVMVVASGPGPTLGAPELELSKFDAVIAGPGLGGGEPLGAELAGWLRALWAGHPGGVAFDADALPCAVGRGAGPRVITPHPGEAGRLLGRPTAGVQADRFGAAEALATEGRVALLKGPRTLVAGGGRLSVNRTGGPVLATGGSGDVLAGVIGALLANGRGARDAARLAAWVHGAAADALAGRRDQGWTASDVAEAIPEAVTALRRAGVGA